MLHSWSQLFRSSSHVTSSSTVDDLPLDVSEFVNPNAGRRFSESHAGRACMLLGNVGVKSSPSSKSVSSPNQKQRTRANTTLPKTRRVTITHPLGLTVPDPTQYRQRRPTYAGIGDHLPRASELAQPTRHFPTIFQSFRRSKGRNRKAVSVAKQQQQHQQQQKQGNDVTRSSLTAAAGTSNGSSSSSSSSSGTATAAAAYNNTATTTRLPLFRSASMYALEQARSEDLVPATVQDLVSRCLKYFDAETGKCTQPDFPKKFFVSHLWFTTSEDLMNIFHDLFLQKKNDVEMKKKIFLAVGFWLREFSQMFLLNASLNHALQILQASAKKDEDVDITVIELNPECDFGRIQRCQMSKRPSDTNRKVRKYSLVFNHLKAQELAIHISYLEHKCFRRLTVTDYLEYAKRGSIKGILKLERAVILCNNITHWVQCMVLENHSPAERATAIIKFVEIAEKLQHMNNFNTLRAIVGALEHTAIARLHKTMGVVPKETMKTLERFVELLDSKANYSKYRRAYAQISGQFKVPILAIVLKDIIAVQAANPDRLEGTKINVKKMYMIGGIFEELIGMQRAAFPFEINTDLVNAVRFALYLEYSEDEIYKMSEDREPRQSRPNGSLSPNGNRISFENIGFADFARYTCQLDTNTMRQHVTNIVNSVFKAYDLDCDGFISEEEFECFARNFQGLDNFETVDEDRDGLISMEEMMDYFLRITSTSPTRKHEVFQNFQHDFIETNYFHPTSCDQCGKLLWGMMKQGWKCRMCGINCHKTCKNRIVVECRQRDNNEKKKKKKSTSKLVVSPTSLTKSNDTIMNNIDDDAFESTASAASSSPPSLILQSSNSDLSTLLENDTRELPYSPKTPSKLTKAPSGKLYPLNEDLSSCESLNAQANKMASVESKIFVFDMCNSENKSAKTLPAPVTVTESSGASSSNEKVYVATPIKRRLAERRNVQRPRSSTVSLLTDKSSASNFSLDCRGTSSMYRCDSGVSGCSSAASWSAPPTPATAENSYEGIKFLYPPIMQPGRPPRISPSSSGEAVSNNQQQQQKESQAEKNAKLSSTLQSTLNGFRTKLKIQKEKD